MYVTGSDLLKLPVENITKKAPVVSFKMTATPSVAEKGFKVVFLVI